MPFPWLQIIISAAFTFLGTLLSPKTKNKDAGQIEVPTATEDRPKPVFYGTVRHLSPNCVWYGNYSATPIRNQVGALQGILSLGAAYLSRQVVGYQYRLGFDLNLGWGQLDEIYKIRMADKDAWTGSLTSEGTIVITNPTLFGGLDAGGNGGFDGAIVVYFGNGTQLANPYVVSKAGATPAYKNDVHLVFRSSDSLSGAYIGNSATLPDMTFDVRRCPNTLGVTGGKHVIDTYDANPVCALYEFMTRAANQFGGGFSPSQFNTANWITAANTLHDEGLGISRMIDQTSDVETIINDFLQLIDATININMTTGQFEIVLARNDYDPDLIPEFDDDTVLEIISFKRGGWVETFNETKLTYIDRTQEYQTLPCAAQDVANAAGQLEVSSQEISIIGLTNSDNANKVTFRELRVVSTPLSTLSIRVNRAGFELYGGGVFKWSSERYGVNEMIFRVVEIDPGNITANSITVKAVQDIFSLGDTAYDAPEPTGWTPPNTGTPTNITNEVLIEQPYFWHGTDNTRVASMAAPADGAQLSYDLYVRESTGSYTSARQTRVPFTPVGTLNAGYTSSAYDTGTSLVVVPVSGMSGLPTPILTSEITAGAGGLIIIGSEILAYESYTVSGGNYTFTGVWGGLLDTVLSTHATGSKVWFISEGIGIDFDNYTAGATMKAKLLSSAGTGSIAIGSATEITL